jgi:AcrR family transcriptional regulator
MSAPRKPAVEREPRGTRRKRETRERLVAAAYRLIAERGVDAVAINEITEAADVGFGSFYNHFASKEAIYDEVFGIVFEEFADTLERLTSAVADPAEIIAISVRHTLLRAQAEPRWGSFFLRESLLPRGITRGLAARLQRDIQKGVEAKRFVVKDSLMALIRAGGTVVAGVAVQAALQQAPAAGEQTGLDTQSLAERTAATVLQGLGLAATEASRVARRRLPAFEAGGSILNAAMD